MSVRQVRYSRYEGPETPDPGQLLADLAEKLLASGFGRTSPVPDPDAGRSFAELLRAIAETLAAGGHVPPEYVQEAAAAGNWQETRLGRLALQLAAELEQGGFLALGPGNTDGTGPLPLTFSLTPLAAQLLGGLALKELTGTGGQLPGGHRTRLSGSSPETAASTRPWRFGDSLSLAPAETLRHAARRGLEDGRIRIREEDLFVHEAELSVRAATVLLLDCSHSMILYGEDRFTPGKKVALALARLIAARYRGDYLRFVLFHDSAEEVTLPQLAGMQVGPFHTNTAEGISLARRLLQRQTAGTRQIIMITDGKPTAITLPGGRIYKNAYGQDAMVLKTTLAEVAACRRQGITINTFMLARDPALLAFVRRMTEMTGGRSYLTSADNVGQFVLQEFSRRRNR